MLSLSVDNAAVRVNFLQLRVLYYFAVSTSIVVLIVSKRYLTPEGLYIRFEFIQSYT